MNRLRLTTPDRASRTAAKSPAGTAVRLRPGRTGRRAVQICRPALHLDMCVAGEQPAAVQAVVACASPGPGPGARDDLAVRGCSTWGWNLDLVAGVAAEQVAVLVAEVGDDLVALAGDVLAGAGLVLDRRAVRRFGAVQVCGRNCGLEEQVAVLGCRVACARQVLDRGRGLGLRPAGNKEDGVAGLLPEHAPGM